MMKRYEASTTITLDNSMSTSQMQEIIDEAQGEIESGANLTIQFTDGTYTMDNTLYVAGFSGAGRLYVRGNSSGSETAGLHTNQGTHLDFSGASLFGLYVFNCTCLTFVDYIKATAYTNSGYTAVGVSGCSATEVRYGYFIGTTNSSGNGGGIKGWYTTLYCDYNYFDNCHMAIISERGAHVCTRNMSFTGTTPAYGWNVALAGIITEDGTWPNGYTDHPTPVGGGVFIRSNGTLYS